MARTQWRTGQVRCRPLTSCPRRPPPLPPMQPLGALHELPVADPPPPATMIREARSFRASRTSDEPPPPPTLVLETPLLRPLPPPLKPPPRSRLAPLAAVPGPPTTMWSTRMPARSRSPVVIPPSPPGRSDLFQPRAPLTLMCAVLAPSGTLHSKAPWEVQVLRTI